MKRLAALFCVALISACSTPIPPATPTPPEAVQSTAAPVAKVAVAQPAPVAKTESPLMAFEKARAGLAAKSVYFEFDKFSLDHDDVSITTEHAKLAKTYPNDHLTLQGNADERGSREYNLALGQKRAEAVMQTLVMLGIPSERLEAVSFGKEKPRALCHEEKCWMENRRVDFEHAWK